MNKTKAIVDFSNYSAVELGPLARAIHDQMGANAATFPSPPVSMAALLMLIEDYAAKLAAKASGAKADTLAFQTARKALEPALGLLGAYVNFLAQGDADVVLLSGIPSYGTVRPVSSGPPAAPEDVRLSHGRLSTTVNLRCRPDRGRSTNEAQVTSGDPNVEAGWLHGVSFSSGKAVLTGLTVGSTVWVRVRTIGPNGVMGAWSDPAKITVV
ncbi:MAG: hypothetical protein ABIP85_17255 [Chthoniobacteraceae bacterium]